MSAIDKLRAIERWSGWMDEHFNEKVKSVSDFEKLYDFCQKSEVYELADQIPERKLKQILGYSI